MNQRQDGTNYYEILEIPPDAPQNEIHRAYQRARATYSQDNPALYSMFTAEESRELLRLIEEAYSVLSNQVLRKTYDDTLMKRGPTPAPESNGLPPGFPTPPPATVSNAQVSTPFPPSFDPAAVASTHRALPDFQTPESTASSSRSTDQLSTLPRADQKAPLPPGMSRTQLSTYKIDESIDAEIENATEFDGTFLQRVRVYKNVSLDRLSDATRISRNYLMALETNDYKSLPAAVFVRGFIVQVARCLAIDENKAAGSYMKLFKAGGGK